MKPLFAFLLCIAPAAVWAQPAPPAPTPAPVAEPDADTVLATAGGKTITYGELKSLMSVVQLQPGAMRDRKALVTQFAFLTKLAEMAEKGKLAEQSPTKEILRAQRMYTMANAQMGAAYNEIMVAPEDVRKFYDASRDRYTQARVKVIYVSFNPSAGTGPGGKKYLIEPEAQAKTAKILAELRKGADFVKMVKQHSEDQPSVAKDGDFGVIRRSDNLPEAIRAAIFALKPGQISDPVRQPNGFYLFRAEEMTMRPFEQVKEEITNELRQARFKQWMDGVQRELNVKFENEAFFSGSAPAPAKPAAPPAK